MVFHPEDHTLIFLARFEISGNSKEKLKDPPQFFYAIDLPTELQPIPNSSSVASSSPPTNLIPTPEPWGSNWEGWSVCGIAPRHIGLEIPLSKLRALDDWQSTRLSLNFKAVAPSTWNLDVSIFGKNVFRKVAEKPKRGRSYRSHRSPVYPLVMSLSSSHIDFDPATLKPTRKSQFLDLELLNRVEEEWVLSEITTIDGQDFHQVIGGRTGKAMMFVPKLEDGNGHGSAWLQMRCPDSFLQHQQGSERNRTVFDKFTGRLYIVDHQKLRVIQY